MDLDNVGILAISNAQSHLSAKEMRRLCVFLI